MATPRRALIVLNAGLGNWIIAAPVIRQLLDQQPGFRYSLIASTGPQATLPEPWRLPGEIEPSPPALWRRFSPDHHEAVLSHLHTHGLDLLINLRKEDPALDGNYFAFRDKARNAGVECWDLHELGAASQARPIGDQICDLLRLHGVPLLPSPPAWLASERTTATAPVIGLFLGASKGVKRWSTRSWVDAVHRIAAAHPDDTIQLTTGTSTDERRQLTLVLAECADLPSVSAVELPGRQALFDWLAGLTGLVTLDTAAAHLAAALGCPTVGLYFSTLGSVWGPRAAPGLFETLQSGIGTRCRAMKVDGTCGRLALGCPAPCRRGVTAEAVATSLGRVLTQQPTPR
ncbi:glycosyltransferase family 9 protein [Kitasatospora sp. NPDC097643]|uniref:glycosyltransferase family 9 protein n=1 Tax=Kitasatospora sp. NPDC097643 TaxID=3157230 RepID=UPI00332FDD4A